ncbi:hydroxypyruvate isomerase family protein [Roseovarius sp. B08]|uniref:hydroxypyruvate isomerase family protein n=1 Tax=Roseovarius sp. B08 TaxID=3449223 RepID=UPI003EDBBAA4
MPRFSANLGFLWAQLALPEAIRAAAGAGFDAVECHCPYDTAPDVLRDALHETSLPLLSLNTAWGNADAGDFGLAALPDRGAEARAAIGAAAEYARVAGAGAIHVMAGKAEGPAAKTAFLENLSYACDIAPDRTILIEPINPFDVPGYFLRTTAQAQEVIAEVGAPNIKLMFDCYHVARVEGDVIARLRAVLPDVGHIQFAAVPDRGAPDHGDVDYDMVFREIDALGWTNPLGAEYRPAGETKASLGWLAQARSRERVMR